MSCLGGDLYSQSASCLSIISAYSAHTSINVFTEGFHSKKIIKIICLFFYTKGGTII